MVEINNYENVPTVLHLTLSIQPLFCRARDIKHYPIRDNPRIGPDPFVKKTINVLQKWTVFLAGPHIQAIQISCQLCSKADIKDSWAHQILQRAHEIFKWPIKIWKFACI